VSPFRKYIGALFIAGLAVAGSATYAAAETEPVSLERASCPEDTVCFFTEPNFQGQQSNWVSPRNPNCDAIPNRPARSVINNTDYPWATYTRGNCEGEADWIAPRTADRYLFSSYSWSG
jgi:hypothetical protein